MKKALFFHWLFGIVSIIFLYSCHSEKQEAHYMIEKYGQLNPELNKLYDYFLNCPERELSRTGLFLTGQLENKYSISDGMRGSVYNDYLDSLESGHTGVSDVHKNYTVSMLPELNVRSQVSLTPDVEILHADSLIQSTELAWKVWQGSPWRNEYSADIFREYVLPYRVLTEPLEYFWRKDCFEKYRGFIDTVSSVYNAALALARQITFKHYALFYNANLQSYSANLKYNRGKCDDRCVLTAMIFRSQGIPCAIDAVPCWGSGNRGHAFNALLLPEDSCRAFNETGELENKLILMEKIPKVYRTTFGILRDTPLYRYREEELLPKLFADHNLLDVTSLYDLETTDVTIPIETGAEKPHLAYLSVFTPQGWKPVAWSEIKAGKARFGAMGTGYNAGQKAQEKGEGIGEGILYLPVLYNTGHIVPAGAPFILRAGAEPCFLTADTTRRITMNLTRKFPRKSRIVNFAQSMENGYFEASNHPDFRDAVVLGRCYGTPKSHIQELKTESEEKYRYVRFRISHGRWSLGELAFLSPQGEKWEGKVIADRFIMQDSELDNVFDGDPLTYFEISGLENVWVGLDLGAPRTIDRIAFCPRTDDNDICPGHLYELFYWDKGWVSLGIREAQNYILVWDQVPADALFWLRDCTKGKEERAFTYEKGRQVWW